METGAAAAVQVLSSGSGPVSARFWSGLGPFLPPVSTYENPQTAFLQVSIHIFYDSTGFTRFDPVLLGVNPAEAFGSARYRPVSGTSTGPGSQTSTFYCNNWLLVFSV